MSLYALGGALINEQMEQIREIARNLLGEEGPPPGAPLAVAGPAAGPWSASPRNGSGFLDAGGRREEQLPGAFSLAGIRRPLVASADPGAGGLAEIRQMIHLLSSGEAAAAADARGRDDRAVEGQGAGGAPADGGGAPAAADARTRPSVPAAGGQAPASGSLAAASSPPADAAGLAPGAQQAPGHDRMRGSSSAAVVSPGEAEPRSAAAGAMPVGAAVLAGAGAAVVDRAADAALQNAVPADAVAMLGLAGGAAQLGGAAADQAGIIGSFILNAHMLPGWPPPIPFAALAASFKGSAAPMPQLSLSEEQVLLYLLNLGLNFEHIARVIKAIRSARRRSNLFTAIANLLSSSANVTHIIERELAALVEDLLQEKRLRTRTLPGARLRTDLR